MGGDTIPGVSSKNAGTAASCSGCPNQSICSSSPGVTEDQGTLKFNLPDLQMILENLDHVKNILLVLSGKGGVGKSTIASLLAAVMAETGLRVGLLDLDICGPSIPIMTGTSDETLHYSGKGIDPVYITDNLSVVSISYLLPSEDQAIVWKGPKKNFIIKKFLRDVNWAPTQEETLDFLIIDTPPGTSDEHISIAKLLNHPIAPYRLSAIVISTSQACIGFFIIRNYPFMT